MKKIAIQGVSGAFHEIAARQYFNGEDIEIVPCVTFRDVFRTMAEDPTIIGIVAIENTIAGSLLQNHNLLRESETSVIGEFKLRISHCLAALPDQKLEDIKEINSHPIALMQCQDFLATRSDWKAVEKEDTALCAKEISQKKLQGVAAICSQYAAEIYGLKILEKGIE